jgi:hypothetical protein
VKESSTNGPVPIGLAKNAFSDLPPKFAGMMAFAKTEMSDRNGAHGALSVKTTLFGPLALIVLIAASRKPSGPFVLAASRLIEKTTSAGVSGVPSENLTPGRRLNVQVRPSALVV